jgi:hypothetical protein
VTSSHPYPATEPSYAASLPAVDPTAVMGRRVAAWVVDSLIIFVPTAALFTSELEYLEEADLDQSGTDFCEDYMDQDEGVCIDVGDRVYFSDGVPAGPWILGLGLSVLIYVLIQGLRGWTPGKLLFGIRTVAEDGRAPGIGRAIIRWLFLIVDTLCAGLVGFIVALTSRGHRRVGDMAAKTFVVGRQYMGGPIAVPRMTTAYTPYPGDPGGPPPTQQPQAWAPPPAWEPPPRWGPAPEHAPPQPTTDESPSDTTAEPGVVAETAEPGAEPGVVAETGDTGAEAEPGVGAETAEPGAEPAARAGPAETGAEAEPGVGAEPAAAPAGPQRPEDAAPAPEPATAAQPQPEASSTAEAGTPAYNPQWDAAWGTYIVWSPERGHWLGWDDTAKEWKRL